LDEKTAREQTKRGIKSVVMGQLQNISSIKLSDLIDKQFLEDVDREVDLKPAKNDAKIPISDLMKQLESKADPLFAPILMKRQKTDNPNLTPKAIIMSPMLALALVQAEQLLSADWRKRQAAACQLRCIFEHAETLPYSLVLLDSTEQKLVLREGQKFPK
jgi:hypothetical protein